MIKYSIIYVGVKNMVEDRIYPCYINGKLYFEKTDFDELLKEQAERIVESLEDILNDPKTALYKDEKFRAYIEDVKAGRIDKIFSPENQMYRTRFDYAVLKFGSYEFVQRLMINSDDEAREGYLRELDDRVYMIQNALLSFGYDRKTGIQTPDYTENLQKIYINFIENFAPQRLLSYTGENINFTMIEEMCLLKSVSNDTLEYLELYDHFMNLNNIYQIDKIKQVLDLYLKLITETDIKKQNELLEQIDSITRDGMNLHGSNIALLNLSNEKSPQTMNQMIDSILMTLGFYDYDERCDISQVVDLLIQKISCRYDGSKAERAKSVIDDNIVHKLVQLSRLSALPEEESKKINDFLDKYFGKDTIEEPDMSKFDRKIAEKEKFSPQEVLDFFGSVMKKSVRDREVPIKYIEFFIAKFVENDLSFTGNLTFSQRMMIMEQFGSYKSRQLVGDKNFITFSDNFIDVEKGKAIIGHHQKGFIKLRPIFYKNVTLTSVVNLVTTFHELRHDMQQQALDEEKFDHMTYMMQKEAIFKRLDHKFYSRNYDSMYEEVDAEYFAVKTVRSLLATLPFDEGFRESEAYSKIIGVLDEKSENIRKYFEKSRVKEVEDGKIADVEMAFDEVMVKHPDILEDIPILKMEYNDDGTRKPLKQIFEEFLVSMGEKENRIGNYDIYKHIFFSRAGIEPEQLDSLKQVQIPEDLPDSVKRAVTKLREIVVSREIPTQTIDEVEEKDDLELE